MAAVKYVSASRVYANDAPPAVNALDLEVKDGELMVLGPDAGVSAAGGAAVQPGRQAARAALQRERRTAAPSGDHHGLRDPRPGRGDDHGSRGGGAGRGPAAAGRHAPPAVR